MKKDLENNLNKDEIVDKENDINVEETTEQKDDFIENTNVTKDDKASEDNLDVDKITEEEDYFGQTKARLIQVLSGFCPISAREIKKVVFKKEL